jgi:drug/metabolite transporter (DMT)-like permease
VLDRARGPSGGAVGLAAALLSAATFGTSGSFGSSLIGIGWTPGAAVTIRVALAAVLLTVPALLALRGKWSLLRSAAPTTLIYGIVAVAGAQLCYFNAVQRMSVGVSLLLEYLGTILVVGWLWLRHGQRPRRLTVAGGVVAVAGLVLVLDLAGAHRLDPPGVLWGLGAAVGLAVYFICSARTQDQAPPLLLAWSGLCIGAGVLASAGIIGVLPMRAPHADVTLWHHQVSWIVPVLGLSVIAAAIAYVSGITAARLLGAKISAFVGLTEVLFAVAFAWVLLGQMPAPLQFAGGGLILLGVSLVRVDELRVPSSAANTDHSIPRSPIIGGSGRLACTIASATALGTLESNTDGTM